jgi:lipopolysaccharide export system protein LptA
MRVSTFRDAINILSAMRRVISVTFFTASILALQIILLPTLNHNTLQAEKKKIILQHADIIEGGETETGSYRSIIGNVVLLHGNLTLKCDRATNYEQENKIVLTGNVFMTDNTVEIYGENGVYYTDRQTGELIGNVRGRMLDNSLVAKSKKAVVNKTTSQIWLYDDAIAWHNRQQINGDIILLHLKEVDTSGRHKNIDEIQVHGNAFFAAQDTLSLSPIVYDQFSGKKMVILLNDKSRITGITLTTQAESLYHLYNNERKPLGINYSSGDMIRMFFTGGVLKRVKVTGNVEGKQYPESFRGDKKINLAKFAWREKENPFKQQKSLP